MTCSATRINNFLTKSSFHFGRKTKVEKSHKKKVGKSWGVKSHSFCLHTEHTLSPRVCWGTGTLRVVRSQSGRPSMRTPPPPRAPAAWDGGTQLLTDELDRGRIRHREQGARAGKLEKKEAVKIRWNPTKSTYPSSHHHHHVTSHSPIET